MPSAHLTPSQLVVFLPPILPLVPMKLWPSWVHTLCTCYNCLRLLLTCRRECLANEFVLCSLSYISGRAVPQNSGFNGNAGWGPDLNILNNNFYTTLLSGGRVANLVPELQNNTAPFTDKFLWRENGRPGFMLNADLALAVDTAGYLNATNGAVNCSLPVPPNIPAGPLTVCPDSPLLATANQYAVNNAAWVSDFRDAFTKMVHTGCNAPTVCTAL
jgi:hypothetical protein